MTRSHIDRDDLYLELRDFIQGRFPDGLISRVDIEESVDREGERILIISAVFEGTVERLIDEKPPGLVRMLQTLLADAQEPAFPMLSFVSARELRA